MQADSVLKVTKDPFHVSHQVEFVDSQNSGSAVFLTHYSSKVHVALQGPLSDRMHAQHDSASITVFITHDVGYPTAGASGKIVTSLKKKQRAQEDALLIERIQHAFSSVIDHSAYSRCTFSFSVHIMHIGSSFLSTVLCACMLCLISAGVECVTTLIPQSCVLVRRCVNGVDQRRVLLNPSEAHLKELEAEFEKDGEEIWLHRTTLAHDIRGSKLLAFVFDSVPMIHNEVTSTAIAQNPTVLVDSISTMNQVCNSEIKGFAQWMKSSYSSQKLHVVAECVSKLKESNDSNGEGTDDE
ncbi:exosome complex exonuclease 1 [Perkinsela sp. CCAP 1560/4]|nr:exosome complex exonuclease 1 [Perkinsela sp. CCAP 1560/4]|eukprot:KNH09661.1 exosome complex exonuclease 1 [Perkinsela sp. CCAP 1560/4]